MEAETALSVKVVDLGRLQGATRFFKLSMPRGPRIKQREFAASDTSFQALQRPGQRETMMDDSKQRV